MLTRIAVVVAVLVVATSSMAAAQNDTSDLDRFGLFNQCQPMDLLVEDLPSDAVDIDLTKERIQTMAESRLRAARLYDDAQRIAPSLHISINVVGVAFNISVTYWKLVYEPASELFAPATTWQLKGSGTHGGDAGYILQGLSEYLDRFVLEYLRVNEDACGQ